MEKVDYEDLTIYELKEVLAHTRVIDYDRIQFLEELISKKQMNLEIIEFLPTDRDEYQFVRPEKELYGPKRSSMDGHSLIKPLMRELFLGIKIK